MAKNQKNIDSKVHLFGLDFFSNPKESLLNELTDRLQLSRKVSYIVTPNPEQIIQSRRNLEFFQALQTADFILPDGIGIVWASRVLSPQPQQILERVPGREVVLSLLNLAEQDSLPILIIGGYGYSLPQLKNQAAAMWKQVTWIEGYQDAKYPTQTEEEIVKHTLQELRPRIVFVALGAPTQELWMRTHAALLESTGVRLCMAVGGTFDILFGLLKPAPTWIVRLNLEWLYRLIQQPWRWKRQLRLLEFVGLVLWERFKGIEG